MSPQDLSEHRRLIAFEVEVILDGYWKDRPADALKAGIMADWMDTLQDWSHEQVVYGLRKWRNANPSRKPNPGHVLAILKQARGAKVARTAQRAPEPAQLPRVTPEAAAEIMAQVNARPKAMRGNTSTEQKK
jgi:hypothetical protein